MIKLLHYKSYKFRIYPSQAQQILINKTIGCSRFIYNYFLDLWYKEYINTNKKLSYNLCNRTVMQMMKDKETIWLNEVDNIAIQSSLNNLLDSFNRYFKKQNSIPQFKSKNAPTQSYSTKKTNNNIIIKNNYLKLPKLDYVKFAKSQEIKGRILRVTIQKKASDKFFITILCEEEIERIAKTDCVVGIDLGIKDFAVLSNGQKIENNKFISKMEEKLKKEQRKLTRRAILAKKKGIDLLEAKNYQKQKCKVARLYEKVMNQRNDFLNKQSSEIIKNYDIICIEDLKVKDMLHNHKLTKNIVDASWSNFIRKIEYKAKWYEKEIIKVDQWFPSTQICSNCHCYTNKKPLQVREWICPRCQAYHDRDINSSINILNEGLRLRNQNKYLK